MELKKWGSAIKETVKEGWEKHKDVIKFFGSLTLLTTIGAGCFGYLSGLKDGRSQWNFDESQGWGFLSDENFDVISVLPMQVIKEAMEKHKVPLD